MYGLDEDGLNRFRKIVAEEKERGCLILLASHVKEDMEQMADSFYYLENGRMKDKK